jgi:hypothetical protein
MEINKELETNLSKLDAFSELEPNWDSEDGLPFTKTHINYIKELLPHLPRQPKIFPTGRGSIQLEYERRNGNYLEFEIYGNRIEVLEVIGDNHAEWTVDEFDVEIINKFYNKIK